MSEYPTHGLGPGGTSSAACRQDLTKAIGSMRPASTTFGRGDYAVTAITWAVVSKSEGRIEA
jgi:hypothetical protein